MWKLKISQKEQINYSSMEGTYESENNVILHSESLHEIIRFVGDFSEFEIDNIAFTIEKVVE